MSPAGPIALAGVILVADRLTKIAVERSISVWDTRPILPGVINLVYTRNRGAAFGILNDAPEAVRLILLVGVSLAVLGLLLYMLWRGDGNRWPLALLVGGALGNLYDRVVYGSVTDFIQIFLGSYEWPSFNVADSAITVGAVWLAAEMFLERKPARGA